MAPEHESSFVRRPVRQAMAGIGRSDASSSGLANHNGPTNSHMLAAPGMHAAA